MVSAATPINLANHVYFNLAGHETGAAGENYEMEMMMMTVFIF